MYKINIYYIKDLSINVEILENYDLHTFIKLMSSFLCHAD